MSDRSTYDTAVALAADLAEDYTAANISDMMITGGKDKAHAVRLLSEANTNQCDVRVQRYRCDQRAMYSAIYSLIEGYKGYKLIKAKE